MYGAGTCSSVTGLPSGPDVVTPGVSARDCIAESLSCGDRVACDSRSLVLAPVKVSLAVGDELRGCIPSNRRKRSRFRFLDVFSPMFGCNMAQTIACAGGCENVKVQVVGYRGILNQGQGSRKRSEGAV